MMRLFAAILLVCVMCTPAYGAATAKERLEAAAAGPASTQGTADSAKNRLNATTSDTATDRPNPNKPIPAKAKLNAATDRPNPNKPIPAKAKLNAVADAAPSYGTFSSDNLRCSYLTKPNMREDGAGTNAHMGGSVLCHLGRIMYCYGGVWNDRGNCDWPKENQAYWIEGSPPPGTPPKEGPEEPGGAGKAGGGSVTQASGGSAAQGGQGVLLGQNPREQELEKERQKLMDEVQQLRQLQQGGREGQGQGVPPQQGAPPRGPGSPQTGAPNRMPLTGGANSQICIDARNALSEIDRMKREIETYSRATTTVPGAIHHTYADLYRQLVSNRPVIEQKMRENNCN